MSDKDNDFARALQMMADREPGSLVGTEEQPFVFFVPQWVEDMFNRNGTTTQETVARIYPDAFVTVEIMGEGE